MELLWVHFDCGRSSFLVIPHWNSVYEGHRKYYDRHNSIRSFIEVSNSFLYRYFQNLGDL